ncbi:MAG: CAF17-like 4Fe-4S cluster assembly/insertion protein YgfZ [Ferrimicrobium sp.]
MAPTWRVITPSQISSVPYASMSITGSDATRFLQGQLAQDCLDIALDKRAISALTTIEGRLLAICQLHRCAENEWVIYTPAPVLDAVIERLLRFRIRVKVSIEPLAPAAFLDLASPTLDPLWPLAEPLSGTELGPPEDDFSAERLRRGAIYLDDLKSSLLLAAVPTLVERGVSFSKGCYVGQELVARTDSRGAIPPTSIAILQGKEGSDLEEIYLLNEPAPITDSDGEEIGVITTALRDHGQIVAVAQIKRRGAHQSHYHLGETILERRSE